jgi:hypothetical protein
MRRIKDILLLPAVFLAALLFKKLRSAGISSFPFCKKVLLSIGVFPVIDHYYEPLFNAKHLRMSLYEDRNLPGIAWNVDEQLALLADFCFSGELRDVPAEKTGAPGFYMNNRSFASGDAEFWYNILRLKKPRTLIEIGSGFSTQIAIRALRHNADDAPGYSCRHVCIEPYEMPWLESTGVEVVRKKVEEVDKSIFSGLGENDVLFIDSSHVIRPQGDVLIEYLEILPTLKKGVIVHVHDIFSPKDYLQEWIAGEVKFWNEQYLLEAFLTNNKEWEIVGALNFLCHRHFGLLREKCSFLTPDREPGSFYIRKTA